jgi:hypothetical protein
LGITVNSVTTSGANWNELDAITAAKDFDLLEWAQHTLPAGDPQYFINNFFRSSAGGNYAGLNSTSVDNLINALSNVSGTARVTASNNAEQAILNLVPVSILMTPQWHVGLGTRLSNYQPYGADYYVITSDFGIGSLPADLNVSYAYVINGTSSSFQIITDAAGGSTAAPGQGQATTAAPAPPATTAAPAAQARSVTGSLRVTVSDPTTFASNASVRTALQQAIADNLDGIDSSMVAITSVAAARRLSDVDQAARRLQSGDVHVNYQITIPASASNVALPDTTTLQNAQSNIKDSLNTRLVQNGVTGITVSNVVANAVATAAATTTVNSDTSGAYGVLVSGLPVASLSLISSLLWL